MTILRKVGIFIYEKEWNAGQRGAFGSTSAQG